jgi:hypothetical protein
MQNDLISCASLLFLEAVQDLRARIGRGSAAHMQFCWAEYGGVFAEAFVTLPTTDPSTSN